MNNRNYFGGSMKSMLARLAFIIAVVLAWSSALFAQPYTLELQGTDATKYPTMTTGFYVRNSAGTVVTSIQNFINNIKVTEKVGANNIPRTVISGKCTEGQNSFSAIIVVDMSGSMNFQLNGDRTDDDTKRKIYYVKQALLDFASNLDSVSNEVCIILFNKSADTLISFTNNRSNIRKKINELGVTIIPGAGTDFNAAFLYKDQMHTGARDSTVSALYYCQKRDFSKPRNPEVAKFKPVIIFLTDGSHSVGTFNSGEVVRIAQERNVHCYAIQFGNDPTEPIDYPNLTALAGIEGLASGNMWTGVTNYDELTGVYSTIMNNAAQLGDPVPCAVNWITDCDGGDATLTFPTYGNITGNSKFVIPDNVKPYLEITLPAQATPFVDVKSFKTDVATITVSMTARNNFVDFVVENGNLKTNIGSGVRFFDQALGTPKYSITPWVGFDPAKARMLVNENRQVSLTYKPSDSLFSEANIEFVSSACSGKIFTTAGEMKPFVDSVYMGHVPIGSSLDSTFTMVFCNKTGKKIHVNKVTLGGTDKASFEILSPLGAFDQDSAVGSCVEVMYRFHPVGTPGLKIATVTFETDYSRPAYSLGGNIVGHVTGYGDGGKAIRPITNGIEPATCTNPEILDTVYLENSGNLNISISSMSFSGANANDYTLISPLLPPTITLLPGTANRLQVIIKFKPSLPYTNAPRIADLSIESDAEVNPFKVPLSGPMENIDFTMANPLSFGMVCVGSPDTLNFKLTNTGNTTTTYNLALPAQFSANPSNIPDLAAGAEATIDVIFNPTADGPTGAQNVTCTTTPCNTAKTLAIDGIGVKPTYDFDPKVSGSPRIDLSATIGSSTPVVCTITNKSASPLTITDIQPASNRFVVSNVNPVYNTSIATNQQCTFTVTYTPVAGDAGILSSKLRIIASTCNFKDSIDLIGNPGLAKTDIVVDKKIGFDKAPVDFGIHLRNKVNFASSNTTLISTEISYDNTLLEQAVPGTYQEKSPVGNLNTITLKAIPVQATDTDQDNIFTLKMRANQKGSLTSTDLVVSNTKADNGGANFVPVNGLFTLNPASAVLKIDSGMSAPAGTIVNVNIYLKGATNITDFNQNILLDLKFGGLILDPPLSSPFIKPTSKFDKTTNEWTLNLELPVKGSGANGEILATLPFMAMLGTGKSTPIEILNPKVKVGSANFTTVIGTFTLAGICKDGETDKDRLFNPNGQAQLLAVKPNPTDGSATLEYEVIENGTTRIWVSDMLGNNVIQLVDKTLSAGLQSVTFDTYNMNTGVYFIIMQTPTQIFKQKLYIVK